MNLQEGSHSFLIPIMTFEEIAKFRAKDAKDLGKGDKKKDTGQRTFIQCRCVFIHKQQAPLTAQHHIILLCRTAHSGSF